jgi:hypothetical protein
MTILEILESTQPVPIHDTVASHTRYIGLLGGLLAKTASLTINCFARESGLIHRYFADCIRAHMGGDILRHVRATIVHYYVGVQSQSSIHGCEGKFADGELLWIQRAAVRKLL